MSLHSCLGPRLHSRIRRSASLSLLVLAALAWSGPVFGNEIHDAAKNGDLAKVQALLKSNPDLVSSKDDRGMTPLHWAASEGRKDVAEFLLTNKADVNAKNNNGQTPLADAAFSGKRDVAELLLVNNADVNAKDNYGWTPLHAAADNGHKDVAELLLANKAGVNAKNDIGWTPLHYAAQGGHKDVVGLLVANHADVNVKNNDGQTALYWAVSQHHNDVADFLRQHGGREGNSAKTGKYRAFLGGAVSVGGDISAIETKFFTCTPVQHLKKGDNVAVMLSDDQAWSVDTQALQIGANQVAYPILAMVKASDGFHSLLPAILRAKADIKPGGILHSDGYRIEAKRQVSAGQSIPVLRVGDSFLSVEAAAGVTGKSKAEPWFAAYKDDTKASDVAALVEAWRIENEHVRK